MTSRSRESRRAAARSADAAASRNRWLLIGGAVLVVIAAAIVALVLTSGSGDGGSSVRPSTSPGTGSAAPGDLPAVEGGSLPDFASPTNDPAVGLTIPTVAATGADGTPIDIALDGSPKALLFVAHWCPHCQAEVPRIQDLVDAGEWPDDVELITVSTSIDPRAPNYPPDAWLAREGWTAPVITDPDGSVASAYGLTAFPFFVFVNADGTVAARATGELPMPELQASLAALER